MKGNKANARGGSNQPSLIGIGIGEEELPSAKILELPSTINMCNILMGDMRNIGFRWPEKEDSQYGGPTNKKKEKNIGQENYDTTL